MSFSYAQLAEINDIFLQAQQELEDQHRAKMLDIRRQFEADLKEMAKHVKLDCAKISTVANEISDAVRSSTPVKRLLLYVLRDIRDELFDAYYDLQRGKSPKMGQSLHYKQRYTPEEYKELKKDAEFISWKKTRAHGVLQEYMNETLRNALLREYDEHTEPTINVKVYAELNPYYYSEDPVLSSPDILVFMETTATFT